GAPLHRDLRPGRVAHGCGPGGSVAGARGGRRRTRAAGNLRYRLRYPRYPRARRAAPRRGRVRSSGARDGLACARTAPLCVLRPRILRPPCRPSSPKPSPTHRPLLPERPAMTVRVALVDDQALVRSGFAMVLSVEDDIEVVGQAADGAAAVDLVRSTA